VRKTLTEYISSLLPQKADAPGAPPLSDYSIWLTKSDRWGEKYLDEFYLAWMCKEVVLVPPQ
jgi:hypothetical protein